MRVVLVEIVPALQVGIAQFDVDVTVKCWRL